ncbi:MAG TPA: LacI family DNA-binding transcriptional regulator [Amnibacterium sp.]|nr:LacI family DNA-binding transcriptional regulator [Amnibacterium sp.]
MDERDRPHRAPSIRDVAEAAGVSYQTVSRVLNDHPKVHPDTAARVQAAIVELGYRPNRAARALVTKRTRTLGVLITARPLYGPFSSFLAIEQAARERGYAVTASPNASDDVADIAQAIDSLLMHGVEGIVAIAPQDRARDAIHKIGARVPVLTLQGAPDEIDGFPIDQRGGARLATRHLVELGHRRILHIPGPPGWAEAEERRRGYLEEMAAHGLEPLLADPGDWTPEAGYISGRSAFARWDVTAVFTANDEMAVGLLAAAVEAGLHVPEDLSVVGFDDIPSARYLAPPLTTVEQDFWEIGRRAIDALIDEIEHGVALPRTPPLPWRLVVRSSTAQVTNRARLAAAVDAHRAHRRSIRPPV